MEDLRGQLNKVVSDMRRETEEASKRGFDEFMSSPLARLGISMIPAGEQPDALKTLLRSAYEAGFHGGQHMVAMHIFQKMIAKDLGGQ